MAVFYIAERLCYRVAFLLSGVCNRHLLAVAGYWRAKKERLAHVRRGLREEVNGSLLAGQKARRGGPRWREAQGAQDVRHPLAFRPSACSLNH
jgi:hypothetical protein